MLWAMALTIVFQAILQRLQLTIRRLLERRLTRRLLPSLRLKFLVCLNDFTTSASPLMLPIVPTKIKGF